MTISWSCEDPCIGFVDNQVLNPPVIINNDAVGVYTLTLAVNDGFEYEGVEAPDVVDTMTLTVNDPDCATAMAEKGTIFGDISGPAGVPDCYVNLYDFSALSADWMSCMDPHNSACENPYQ